MAAWNTLDSTHDEIIANCRLAIEALCDQTALEEVIKKKRDEVLMLTELTKRHIDENARMQCDQVSYQKLHNELLEKYRTLSAELVALEKQRTDRKLQTTWLTAFVDTMEQSRQVLDTFSEPLWAAVVEKATVYPGGKITFVLMDGTEISA